MSTQIQGRTAEGKPRTVLTDDDGKVFVAHELALTPAVDQGDKGTAAEAWYVQLVDAAQDALSAAIGANVPAGAVQVGGKDGSGKLRALALGTANQLLGLPAAIGRLARAASTSVALS